MQSQTDDDLIDKDAVSASQYINNMPSLQSINNNSNDNQNIDASTTNTALSQPIENVGLFDPANQNMTGGYTPTGTYDQPYARTASKVLASIMTPGLGVAERGVPAVISGAKAILPAINKGVQYLRPDKTSEEFMQNLGGGKTAEENAQELANRLSDARKANEVDALTHKQKVLDEAGKENIYKMPKESLPEGNLDKVAKIFSKDKSAINDGSLDELSKALVKYRKDNNISGFIEKGENLFNRSEGLSDKETDKVEDVLSVPTSRDRLYLDKGNAVQHYSPDLLNYHTAFERKPTFENGDVLQSEIGKQIGSLQKLRKLGKLDKSGGKELYDLTTARNYLIKDQNSFLRYYSPELKNEYDTFRDKWRENVTPYDSKPILTQMSKNPGEEGFKPSDISSVFANPKTKVQKILEDIGDEGKKNVLYNKLQGIDSGDAAALSKALMDAKNLQGYQRYVTPEMEALTKDLSRRATVRKYVNRTGETLAGLGGGTILGHPLIGAGIGLMGPTVRSMMMKLLEQSAKKI